MGQSSSHLFFLRGGGEISNGLYWTNWLSYHGENSWEYLVVGEGGGLMVMEKEKVFGIVFSFYRGRRERDGVANVFTKRKSREKSEECLLVLFKTRKGKKNIVTGRTKAVVHLQSEEKGGGDWHDFAADGKDRKRDIVR